MIPDPSVLENWGARALAPMAGGARGVLWRVEIGGVVHVARASGASEPSLHWLARLMAVARQAGLVVAPMLAVGEGRLSVGGWTLEPFLQGAPGQASDLAALVPGLARLHRRTRDWPGRPGQALPRLPDGVARRVRQHRPAGERAAIHADLHPGNVLRLPGGRLGVIDWDEARRDVAGIDRLALAPSGHETAAHLAVEVAACWRAEPAPARRLARALVIWT